MSLFFEILKFTLPRLRRLFKLSKIIPPAMRQKENTIAATRINVASGLMVIPLFDNPAEKFDSTYYLFM